MMNDELRTIAIQHSSYNIHHSSLLAIRLSALGDVIHTIPAVVALRDRYDVTWVVEAPYREVVEIVAKVKAIPVTLRKWRSLPRTSREIRGFDVAIDFQGLIKSALIARASGAKERIGFARDLVREKPAAWFTNRHVRVDATQHVVDWNLALASSGGEAPTPVRTGEAPVLHWKEFASGDFPDLRGKIVLLPGAGRPEKMWPLERFRELAHQLGDRAVAVWGPGEEELAKSIGCAVAPRTSLRELASLLQYADVVIGADTGPLHLADALGTRVIGLYGPTNPKRNGPYGQLDRCISTFETTKRMDAISAGDVMRLIE
jgi:lipopolysaccharide heptosyltransferase I